MYAHKATRVYLCVSVFARYHKQARAGTVKLATKVVAHLAILIPKVVAVPVVVEALEAIVFVVEATASMGVEVTVAARAL